MFKECLIGLLTYFTLLHILQCLYILGSFFVNLDDSISYVFLNGCGCFANFLTVLFQEFYPYR